MSFKCSVCNSGPIARFVYVSLFLQAVLGASHQLFGFKEALEVPHLPDGSDDEDDGLGDGPPQDTLVRALTRHTEALLSILHKTQTCFMNKRASIMSTSFTSQYKGLRRRRSVSHSAVCRIN